MFLFGFYFPEPLPYFTRPGLWRKWLPWIVVAPYAALRTRALEPSSSLRSQTIPLPSHSIAFFDPMSRGNQYLRILPGERLLQLYLHQIRNEHLPGCKTAASPPLLGRHHCLDSSCCCWVWQSWIRRSIEFPDWLIGVRRPDVPDLPAHAGLRDRGAAGDGCQGRPPPGTAVCVGEEWRSRPASAGDPGRNS